MKSLLLAATLFVAFSGSPTKAQALHDLIAGNLGPGQVVTYSYRMDPADKGTDIGIRCAVPAMTLGVVTFAKISSGPSRNDIEVADSIATDGHGKIITDEVIAKQNGGGKFPSVLLIPPDSQDWNRMVVLHPRDNFPAQYHIYCDNVNLAVQVLWAAGRTALTYALSSNDLQPSDNASRALNLGLSLIERDNVMAIGLDAFREEVMIELNKQFPNNPILVTFFGSFVDNLAQEAFKHAFYEMSPHLSR